MDDATREAAREESQRRDRFTGLILGGFLGLLGVLILLGLPYAELMIDRVLIISASLALLLVSAGFLLRARTHRSQPSKDEEIAEDE